MNRPREISFARWRAIKRETRNVIPSPWKLYSPLAQLRFPQRLPTPGASRGEVIGDIRRRFNTTIFHYLEAPCTRRLWLSHRECCARSNRVVSRNIDYRIDSGGGRKRWLLHGCYV